jgi:hypothetical protein
VSQQNNRFVERENLPHFSSVFNYECLYPCFRTKVLPFQPLLTSLSSDSFPVAAAGARGSVSIVRSEVRKSVTWTLAKSGAPTYPSSTFLFRRFQLLPTAMNKSEKHIRCLPPRVFPLLVVSFLSGVLLQPFGNLVGENNFAQVIERSASRNVTTLKNVSSVADSLPTPNTHDDVETKSATSNKTTSKKTTDPMNATNNVVNAAAGSNAPNTSKIPLNPNETGPDVVENETTRFSGENHTTTVLVEAESRCWRSDCPFPRKNLIVLSHIPNAGWNDRMFIMGLFSDMAGYLCADLYVPSPHLMLHPGHNGGNPLEKDLMWSDIVDLKFGYNQTIQEIHQPPFVHEDDKSLRIISNSDDGNWEMFLQLENFTLAQVEGRGAFPEDHFIWEIRTNPYSMDLYTSDNPYHETHHRPESFPFRTPFWRNDGCIYMPMTSSSIYVKRVVNDVMRQIQITEFQGKGNSSITGAFHVRRGDAKGECDTSIERITRYLDCSFANTKSIGNFTLLLSTDELDWNYIDSLLAIPQRNSTLSHVRIQWLDRILRRTTRRLIENGQLPNRLQNNYFIFVVSNEIREMTSFELSQRRHQDCADCRPVERAIARKAAYRRESEGS